MAYLPPDNTPVSWFVQEPRKRNRWVSVRVYCADNDDLAVPEALEEAMKPRKRTQALRRIIRCLWEDIALSVQVDQERLLMTYPPLLAQAALADADQWLSKSATINKKNVVFGP